MISIVDRSSTARAAVKLAQTAYTCLLLPTRLSGCGGHGADAVKLAQTAQACLRCAPLPTLLGPFERNALSSIQLTLLRHCRASPRSAAIQNALSTPRLER